MDESVSCPVRFSLGLSAAAPIALAIAALGLSACDRSSVAQPPPVREQAAMTVPATLGRTSHAPVNALQTAGYHDTSVSRYRLPVATAQRPIFGPPRLGFSAKRLRRPKRRLAADPLVAVERLPPTHQQFARHRQTGLELDTRSPSEIGPARFSGDDGEESLAESLSTLSQAAISRLPRVEPQILIEEPASGLAPVVPALAPTSTDDLTPPEFLPNQSSDEPFPVGQTASEPSSPLTAHPPPSNSQPPNIPPPAVSRLPDVAPQHDLASEPVKTVDQAQLPGTTPALRSPEMDEVARRAASLSRQAFRLADRGALYSARSNFIQALRMITQALDAHDTRLFHGKALAAGMQAIREAEDFVPRGTSLEADLDVPAIIAAHRTPILKQSSSDPLASKSLASKSLASKSLASKSSTPSVALQRYFAYAQQQLAAAGGTQVAASMALHGLGKVQSAIAARDRSQLAAAGAKAIVLQRAALLVDRGNYLAANELGVLLARYGQLRQSRGVLIHSVSIASLPTTWHNLAVVHRKLGEADLAALAENESRLAARTANDAAGNSSDRPVVRWVSPQAFAGNRPIASRPVTAKSQATKSRATAAPATKEDRQAHWWTLPMPWKK